MSDAILEKLRSVSALYNQKKRGFSQSQETQSSTQPPPHYRSVHKPECRAKITARWVPTNVFQIPRPLMASVLSCAMQTDTVITLDTTAQTYAMCRLSVNQLETILCEADTSKNRVSSHTKSRQSVMNFSALTIHEELLPGSREEVFKQTATSIDRNPMESEILNRMDNLSLQIYMLADKLNLVELNVARLSPVSIQTDKQISSLVHFGTRNDIPTVRPLCIDAQYTEQAVVSPSPAGSPKAPPATPADLPEARPLSIATEADTPKALPMCIVTQNDTTKALPLCIAPASALKAVSPYCAYSNEDDSWLDLLMLSAETDERNVALVCPREEAVDVRQSCRLQKIATVDVPVMVPIVKTRNLLKRPRILHATHHC